MDQVHGPSPWGGPWTGSMGWSMDPGPCFVYPPCIWVYQLAANYLRSRGYIAKRMERSINASISCYMLEQVFKIINKVAKKSK